RWRALASTTPPDRRERTTQRRALMTRRRMSRAPAGSSPAIPASMEGAGARLPAAPRQHDSGAHRAIGSALDADTARRYSADAGTARGADRDRDGRYRQLGCLDSTPLLATARTSAIPPGARS